jgi:hypothetical protein
MQTNSIRQNSEAAQANQGVSRMGTEQASSPIIQNRGDSTNDRIAHNRIQAMAITIFQNCILVAISEIHMLDSLNGSESRPTIARSKRAN